MSAALRAQRARHGGAHHAAGPGAGRASRSTAPAGRLGADAATFMSSPPSADLNSHAALTPRASGEPPTVFGTGLLALDIILSADPRRAPVLAAGGTCGNVLTALAYLGWEAYPVARLNDDVASAIVRADLERSGVALDFAAQAPGAATPIIVQAIRHDRRGAPTHRFSLACPACGAWFPSYRAVVQDAALAVVDAVADAAYGGFAGPRVFFFDRVSRGALTLARAFANRGALIVFEPVGIGDPKLFAEALNVTHVLKYSRERVPMLADRSLTGGFGEWSHTGPRGRGPRIEIETMGAEGLRFRTVHDSGARWRVLPAISSPIVRDTAGAGDWCTAGFLASLGMAGVSGVEGATVSEVEGALRVGQAAAAIGCSFEGARGVMSACSATEFQNAVNAALHPTELGTSSGMPVVGDAQALTDFAFAPTPALHCENPAAKNGRVRALATPLGVETWTGVCPACPREALV